MIVTVEWLKSLKACTDQVELFEATFGESVEVTRESLTRANGAGLDLDWFGRNAFGDLYDEAFSLVLTAYIKARAPVIKVYKEASAEAWETYKEEILKGEALNAGQEVRATAWKAYQEATAKAWETRNETCASAWKAYQEALIEVIFNLSQVTITP